MFKCVISKQKHATSQRITETDIPTGADISISEFGRKEIDVAEHEMPGLMATEKAYL